MQQRHFWESISFLASQNIPRVLKKTKVHCLTHNSPPIVSVLSYMNPVHAFPSCSLRYFLILSSRLLLGLPSLLIPYGFLPNILYAFLSPYLPRDPPISYSLMWQPEKIFGKFCESCAVSLWLCLPRLVTPLKSVFMQPSFPFLSSSSSVSSLHFLLTAWLFP